MTVFSAATLGLLFGLGLWLVLLGLANRPVLPRPTLEGDSTLDVGKLAIAVVAGALGALVTGWVVLGVLIVIGVLMLWGRLGSKKTAQLNAARAEAIAAWIEQVSGALRSGAHLNGAILTASTWCAPEIAEPARALARDIETLPLDVAIGRFGRSVDHPAADGACASIALASRHGSNRLSEMFEIEARQARAYVAMANEVTASRAQSRASALGIIGISLTMMLGLRFFAGALMGFYDSAIGQLALMIVGALFLLALWLLSRLMDGEKEARFFDVEAVL